jgi:hypothetical protein
MTGVGRTGRCSRSVHCGHGPRRIGKLTTSFGGPSCGPSTTPRATTLARGHDGEKNGRGERSRRGRDGASASHPRSCALSSRGESACCHCCVGTKGEVSYCDGILALTVRLGFCTPSCVRCGVGRYESSAGLRAEDTTGGRDRFCRSLCSAASLRRRRPSTSGLAALVSVTGVTGPGIRWQEPEFNRPTPVVARRAHENFPHSCYL